MPDTRPIVYWRASELASHPLVGWLEVGSLSHEQLPYLCAEVARLETDNIIGSCILTCVSLYSG